MSGNAKACRLSVPRHRRHVLNRVALRSATVAGCSVNELKQARKGHEFAFRVDLLDSDSAGDKKYVLSVDTGEEKQLWMSRLRAYSYLSVEEVSEVMRLAADAEAAASATGILDDYGDET